MYPSFLTSDRVFNDLILESRQGRREEPLSPLCSFLKGGKVFRSTPAALYTEREKKLLVRGRCTAPSPQRGH